MMLDFILRRCHLSERKEQIAKNLFWAVIGKVTTLLGSLFVGIIIARYLGPEQYGLMNYVISYVQLFQIFAIFGLDNIEVREEAKGDVDYPVIIGTAFAIKLVLAFITVALTIVTSLLMEADAYTTILVSVYSISIVANAFNVIRNYFTAMMQNEYVVKSEIGRTILGTTIKVVLLLCGANLTFFVLASAFDCILLASGYCIAYKKKIGSLKKWEIDKCYALFLLKESFPLLLTSAAVIIYQRIDQVMIGQMIDNRSVGFFSVATRIVEILVYVPTILVQTLIPILVGMRQDSEEIYRCKAQSFMNTTLWLTVLVSAVMSILSYGIVLLLFGEQYTPAAAILQVLSFKAVAMALSSAAGNMLVVENLQRFAIFRDVLGCVVCILLNYYLLPLYGVMAAAVVAIVSNVVAGYVADALIPSYRHLFVMQTKALLFGWKDILKIRTVIRG